MVQVHETPKKLWHMDPGNSDIPDAPTIRKDIDSGVEVY